MNNQEQKKLKKRKARADQNRKNLLKKRHSLIKEKQSDKEEFLKKKEHKKLLRKFEIMQETYDNLKNDLTPEQCAIIEKNIEVLKDLEGEHDMEARQRELIHKELEEKGLTTLEEKIEFLKQNSLEENSENFS